MTHIDKKNKGIIISFSGCASFLGIHASILDSIKEALSVALNSNKQIILAGSSWSVILLLDILCCLQKKTDLTKNNFYESIMDNEGLFKHLQNANYFSWLLSNGNALKADQLQEFFTTRYRQTVGALLPKNISWMIPLFEETKSNTHMFSEQGSWIESIKTTDHYIISSDKAINDFNKINKDDLHDQKSHATHHFPAPSMPIPDAKNTFLYDQLALYSLNFPGIMGNLDDNKTYYCDGVLAYSHMSLRAFLQGTYQFAAIKHWDVVCIGAPLCEPVHPKWTALESAGLIQWIKYALPLLIRAEDSRIEQEMFDLEDICFAQAQAGKNPDLSMKFYNLVPKITPKMFASWSAWLGSGTLPDIFQIDHGLEINKKWHEFSSEKALEQTEDYLCLTYKQEQHGRSLNVAPTNQSAIDLLKRVLIDES